ncbi:MAG: 30S ribosomal protein S8e [archaeon]|nr:30S ribosomal protein S8e [archaeon]
MTQWHMKSRKKVSGGNRASRNWADKKKAWLGGDFASTTISITEEPKRDVKATTGGNVKVKLKAERFVMASDTKKPKEKPKRMEIISVEENNADRQFARRNIITRGAVLKVKDGSKEGFVKVTSRPGQAGNLLGIHLENFESEKAKKPKAENKEDKKEKTVKKAKAHSKSKKKAEKEE